MESFGWVATLVLQANIGKCLSSGQVWLIDQCSHCSLRCWEHKHYTHCKHQGPMPRRQNVGLSAIRTEQEIKKHSCSILLYLTFRLLHKHCNDQVSRGTHTTLYQFFQAILAYLDAGSSVWTHLEGLIGFRSQGMLQSRLYEFISLASIPLNHFVQVNLWTLASPFQFQQSFTDSYLGPAAHCGHWHVSGNGSKPHQGRFKLGIRKLFFTESVVKTQTRLPGEEERTPGAEMAQSCQSFRGVWTMPKMTCLKLVSSEVVNPVYASDQPLWDQIQATSKLDYFKSVYTHIYTPKHPANRTAEDQAKLSISFYQMKRKPKQIWILPL